MELCVWILMPKMMINVHESKLGFDKTVMSVEEAISQYEKWKTLKTFDIRQNITDEGFDKMAPVKIVTLCQPRYAHRILTKRMEEGL